MFNSKSNWLLVVFLLGVLGGVLFFKEDAWMGFYYPYKENLTIYTQSAKLKSLEECRAWVDSQSGIIGASDAGYDYECGKSCKFKPDFGAYECKETIK